MKFNKFLLDLNLSEINVNADGLCFISSIRSMAFTLEKILTYNLIKNSTLI
jgi:hypothetical protein